MSAAGEPRITFGMIVLNGMPFVPYCLRGLYPFAHEIIVVEGASPLARQAAGPDGHSTDDTLAAIRRFQAEEDPQRKVILVTAEDEGHPDGFWPGEKDQQSRAYARRATGNYLWQVDSDEFYKAADLRAVLDMLRDDPAISAVSFPQITFWGGFDCWCDSWYLRKGADVYHRLFRWGPGYTYATHRPPTVLDPAGRDLRRLRWVRGQTTRRKGIFLYHYSLLFPQQVTQKCRYYGNHAWGAYSRGVADWPEVNFLHGLTRPFQAHNVHTHPGWLCRFRGAHPESIRQMREDLATGRLQVLMRPQDDVIRLLDNRTYRVMCRVLAWLWPLSLSKYLPRKPITRFVQSIGFDEVTGRLIWPWSRPRRAEVATC
jgi:hypothetical protein